MSRKFLLVKKVGRYLFTVLLAADRLLAAILGCSGKWTLSAECAFSDRPLLLAIHKALEFFLPGHCQRSAVHEGAYCRISTRKLGDK